MLAPLVKQDLDSFGCSDPKCPGDHPLSLTSICHPASPTLAAYDSSRGVIIIACHACRIPICEIEVATATIQ